MKRATHAITALDKLVRETTGVAGEETVDLPRNAPARSSEPASSHLNREQLADLRLAARLVDEARGYVEGIDRKLAYQMGEIAARLRQGSAG